MTVAPTDPVLTGETTAPELLAHAQSRQGWSKLTPRQRQRACAMFLVAECPGLGIITTNNALFRTRLGWSMGTAQRMVSALKRARLLAVERKWETLPDGRKRELGPAAWVYTTTDTPHQSQLPKPRAKRTDARLRSLQSQVDVLSDDLIRLGRNFEELRLEVQSSRTHNGGLSG